MQARWLLLLAAPAALAFAWFNADPVQVMADINKHRTDELAKLRASGKPLTAADLAPINAKAKEMAEAAMKGVDLKSVEASKAYAWAQVAQAAQQQEPVIGLLEKFLASGNPNANDKYMASQMGFVTAASQRDIAKALKFAESMTPTNEAQTISRVSMILGRVAGGLHGAMGQDQALKYIESLVASLPAKATDTRLEASLTAARAAGMTARIEVFKASGDRDALMAELDRAIAAAPEDRKRSLMAQKVQLTLPGQTSPDVKADKFLNNFQGWEAYKGKIVILDFFAHWCGPCKASFPDLRKLYADLHDKGVEIIHATRFYGSFGQERDLTPEVEFDRMKGFVKEHQLAWPVIFVENDVFAKFGVSGIPHIVLIDENGKVDRVKIGYSAATFAEFRARVEQLVQSSKR